MRRSFSLPASVLALASLVSLAPAQVPAAGNLTGTLQQVINDQITLLTAGHPVILQVPANAQITLDGKSVMITDLRAGMSALVIAPDGRYVSEIRATTNQANAATNQQQLLTGIVLQAAGNQLTLQTPTRAMTFGVMTTTALKVDGKPASSLGEIKPGMNAQIIASDATTAAEIRAFSPNPNATPPAIAPLPPSQTGVITKLADNKLMLQAAAHAVEFTLTEKTVYKLDEKVVTQADIKTGFAAIVYAADGKVTELRAYTPQK